jgi:catechol 2,3-dioxygenase-like lactoylglutathione lyase family enzyme
MPFLRLCVAEVRRTQGQAVDTQVGIASREFAIHVAAWRSDADLQRTELGCARPRLAGFPNPCQSSCRLVQRHPEAIPAVRLFDRATMRGRGVSANHEWGRWLLRRAREGVDSAETGPVEYAWEVRCFFRDPDGHLLEISEARTG